MPDDTALLIVNADLDAVLARQTKENARRAVLQRNAMRLNYVSRSMVHGFVWPTAKGWKEA